MALNFHCPGCETLAQMVMGPTQAFCESENCHVVTFNPSLPFGGASNAAFIELPPWLTGEEKF
jgi:hypothetical protein